jgi:hypothetical protein
MSNSKKSSRYYVVWGFYITMEKIILFYMLETSRDSQLLVRVVNTNEIGMR